MRYRAVAVWGLFLAACAKAPEASSVKTAEQPTLAMPPPKAAPAPAELAIISRRDLFGAPDHLMPLASHDGKNLAWLAPVEGVLNVWMAPAQDPTAAKPVTHDNHRGIRSFQWSYDGRHVLYQQENDGDENWHINVLDVTNGQVRDATPFQSVKASVVGLSPRKKAVAIVALNRRDPEWEDLFELDLDKAVLRPVYENRAGLTNMLVSDDFKLVVGEHQNSDGSKDLVLVVPGKNAKPGRTIATISFADEVTTQVLAFSSDGKTLYLADSRDRDTSAVVALDLASGATQVLATDPKSDVSDVIFHPSTHVPQVATFEYDAVSTVLLDTELAADMTTLRGVDRGAISWTATLDDRHWVVTFTDGDVPPHYYLYDRGTGEARFLFSQRSVLEKAQLAHRRAVLIPARDGVELVAYLTLPFATPREDTQLPERPLPMVVYVHGGPWTRDSEGFDAVPQWLANRGHAVLQVNYRGSTGFGKRFVNLANRGWGGVMHDDLVDGVQWAVAHGVTTADQVAIFGGGYGGYATLVALSRTPALFRCGIDIAGPSNLETFIAAFPPDWKPYLAMVYERVGDPRNEDGRALLRERSPLGHADAIVHPLLIAQGAKDTRVKRAESEQLVASLRRRNVPVTYAVFPDEGHGFSRPVNRLAFFALAEEFLTKQLGGRAEPRGADCSGTTMQMVTP